MAFSALPGFDQLWREMRRFQRDFARLDDAYGRGTGLLSAGVGGPLLNLSEDAEHVYAEAELPGFKQDQLEIYVVGRNQLVLKGERKPECPEKSICHRQERGLTSFARSLTLPADVDPDQVEARLEHGVLTVRLAKSATARPKKIMVRGD